jgi:eukaryotic-like serine/threonine-protein kinase
VALRVACTVRLSDGNQEMDQDRWKAVNHLFHAALEVSPSERDAFVSKASGGDEALEREVKLLLKADQDANSYFEAPLVNSDTFRNTFRSWFPKFAPGDILCGRFKIVRPVGEGGMKHVFEAFDTELGVMVALKTIRPEIAANPEALARFRQEVRLARRITHPNVCRTFDLERETRVLDEERGTQQEILFLTMEFLEGETLAARIRREGALPLKDATVIARQVAGALDAARALGVVHRDIKPGNIMLAPSKDEHGFRAVVTDFG